MLHILHLTVTCGGWPGSTGLQLRSSPAAASPQARTCMLKLTATALRTAFQLSSAAEVSRLALAWGSHILLMGAYASAALSMAPSPRPMMAASAAGSVTTRASCQRNLARKMPP